jgi:DNA replicative helicase MCM subunit Mcm2 (Cdc46/Mcm family)
MQEQLVRRKAMAKKSPDHATTNQTRKINSGKAAASNRTPPSVGIWALSAGALVTATSAIATYSAEYISPNKTEQHR